MKSEEEKEAGTNILKQYGSFFKKQHKDFVLLDKSIWVENKTYQPIFIKMEQKEIITIPNLISSDNTLMNKVLGVLSSLCIEIISLRNEAFEKHFCFLSVYDEYNNNDMESQIEAICLLSAFITRCNDTLKNICSQVFAIFTESVINLNKIQLHYIINHIGEMFTVLVILELLLSNSSIARNWNKYCKNFKSLIQKYKSDIDLSYEKISALSDAVGNITTKVMNGDIVQSALSNILTLRSSLTDKNSSIVATEFSQYIKQAIINLDKLVQEKPSINNMYKCIKMNALFVLSSQLFGTLDKKTFKTLLELDAKVHSIHIIGATMWFPEQFLQRHVPSMSGSYNKLSQTMLKARQSYITIKKTCVNRDLVTLQNLSSQWILSMELTFSEEHYELNASEMSHQAKILFEGLDVASHIQYYVLTLINLHLTLSVPLSKNMLMAIFEIIDILKSLQNVVTRHHSRITKSINMILQHLTYQATAAILQVKKTLMTDKNYANKRLDDLTCLVIAERALKGTTTLERNIAANVALSFVPDTTYIEDSYAKLGNLLEKILTLSNFLSLMDNFGNCYWMLWHQNVLPIYFEQNFSATENVLRLKYFVMVIDDCVLFLNKTDKLNNENKSQELFNNMKCLIEESFLKNMGQSIETNLRLHIHSHLQLQAVNPFTNEMIKKLLFAIDNFRVHTIYMGVIPTVEHYLSTMYYNLTTVVLSDWKTYGEMRQMAKFKFNLLTVQDNLPTQTLEQGLDVLEIMRNIHIFVSRYNYNLNNQIFIEKSSNNKHLNSINIKHIANSIRTHGTGIMNTTVNFTYQFLKKKFFTFSQFMYDEHIKSRLYKDCRNFKENSVSNANMYPYKSAEKFNKGIRMLGLAENGQTYLDLFRDLISQIGNAMGYVRMIRTGGRHCCSDATMFLPNLECKGVSTELIVESNFTSKTIESAENFNDNINDLLSNFLQGTEYFKLLVNVFAPVFRNPKNIHLKNFYIIIPPLTLNFVEHMILSKDKMSKKNKSGAAFTDDGFAMGVAYILKLLDQEIQFEALHWFDSVWSYIQNERKTLDEQIDKGPVQLQQALALTEKKINTLETEFKLLYYSFCSARIFFK